MSAHLNAYIAILAGGVGSRFWPASTRQRPKQFLPLASDTALIDETLDRAVQLVGESRVRVIASAQLLSLMRDSLDRRGVDSLAEPQAKGTGPALAWAAYEIERESPGAVMISMHADHRISPPAGLRATLEESMQRAREGYLCCIGVRPNRPETGYGYMQLGDELDRSSFEVKKFVEKPDIETAKRYAESGDYLWNSGIFVWHCADLLTAVEAHAHELHRAIPLLSQGDVQGFFDVANPIAIDVGVLERAGRIAATEARFEWDDLGVWTAVARSRGVDDRGNSVVGAARLLASERNVVWTESLRATLIGVSDMVVVEANDELLVLSRAEADRLNLHIRKLEEQDNTSKASDTKESA